MSRNNGSDRNDKFLHNLASQKIKKNAAQDRLVRLQKQLAMSQVVQGLKDNQKIPLSDNYKIRNAITKKALDSNSNKISSSKSKRLTTKDSNPKSIFDKMKVNVEQCGKMLTKASSNIADRLKFNKALSTKPTIKPPAVKNEIKVSNSKLCSTSTAIEDDDIEMGEISETENVAEILRNQIGADIPKNQVEEMEYEEFSADVVLTKLKEMRQKKQFSDHKIPEVNPTHENSSKSLLTKTGCFDEKFFVIIDTNVFLSNLKFLSELSKRHFKDVGSPILLIPYVVLQELDQIKHRPRVDSFLAKNATNSINYLNERLKIKDPSIKGQSAIEAKNLLIDINNPDDNIINYCIQVGQTTKKLILITNDNNLRNKAFINGFEAFSRDEIDSEPERIKFS